MKIVIVGAVAGGASAAARLRRLDEHAEIIMLERGAYISYANCGLPYYIGGLITDEDELTLQTPESFHARFNVDVHTLNEVKSIDRAAKTVLITDHKTGRDYTESYDRLIISPGAEPVRPPLPGADDPRVLTLRTVPDAFRLRGMITEKPAKTAVIIGGGFIGLEMAENLAHAGLGVTVVELADHVIGALDFDAASEVHQYLRSKGVELILKHAVRAFLPGAGALGVELDDGTLIKTDFALISVGVRPESTLARNAGLEINERGAIIVDGHMRTSDSDIYAVGDAVAVRHFVSGREAYIPLAGPANKQGRIAADNICGLDTVYKGSQGSSILKLFNMTVAATGLNETAAKAAGFDYDKVFTFSAAHAAYYPGATSMTIKTIFEKPSGRILGAQIVGFDGVDKRCDVIATAIRAGMTAYDLAELELCYAPPFSSAKDPVNMAGYAIENILTGKLKQFHWYDVPSIAKDPHALLFDVRTNRERAQSTIPGSFHIPLDSLRERMHEVPKGKTLYVFCRSGLRSYIACRILAQNGYDCYNLSGGYRLHEIITAEK